jgi:carbon storage regulator CsrA
MLVLTRKHQEKIRIGDDIVITVLRSKGKSVRLGIEAPASVPVLRGELAYKIAAAEEHAPPQDDATHGEELSPLSGRRSSAQASRSGADWSTESSPQSARGPREAEETQVMLRRIPRSKMADALPRLVSGVSPLRVMLDDRAASR